jgi:hypothetical protein
VDGTDKEGWMTLFNELEESQRAKINRLGKLLVQGITDEDLLQPNDFPILEGNPYFRYEEGVLEGIMSARFALCAMEDLAGIGLNKRQGVLITSELEEEDNNEKGRSS